MNPTTLAAFEDELMKIAANPAANPSRVRDWARGAKKVLGGHLREGAKKATDSLAGASPMTRAAVIGGAMGAIPGAVSGVFDGRGNPTVGKRLKRGLKRGAQWGVSGAGLGALQHYIRANNLGN